MPHEEDKRQLRWYFGGVASACATMITHPLDLVKVHLQTSQSNLTFMGQISQVCKTEGVFGLYNGLSASLLRQMTYSLSRFAIYGELKKHFNPHGHRHFAFPEIVAMTGFAGFMGGVIGTPADVINVRMQNDIRLPPEKRRNYKHAFDGLYRVYKEEGVLRLFSGITFASIRAAIITIGQIAFYEEVKLLLLDTDYFDDDPITHFAASFTAGGIATVITQPVDVLKTRQMNSKPGEFKTIFHTILHTAKLGPTAFFKGVVPAFIRLGPHTVLQFMIIEQLRLHFGYVPVYED